MGRERRHDYTDATPGSDDDVTSDEQARWLDRASGEVESRLGGLGQDYLLSLVRTFERRWREAERAREDAGRPPGTGGDDTRL